MQLWVMLFLYKLCNGMLPCNRVVMKIVCSIVNMSDRVVCCHLNMSDVVVCCLLNMSDGIGSYLLNMGDVVVFALQI